MNTLNLVFRKPSPRFNSIETVFNAILPYLEEEFVVERIYMPHATRGISSMRKNVRYLRERVISAPTHITGHDNYLVKGAGKRSILTFHDLGSAFNGNSIRDSYIRYNWFAMPIRRAKAITVISQFSADELTSMFPAARGKLKIIPNPVDERIEFTPRTFRVDKLSILQVGTKANKNLERVIDVLRGTPYLLNILGELSEEQKALLKTNAIHYKSYTALKYHEVMELYQQSDILLYASLYEGFGMPILEAQATGRPVITSNTAAMPDTAGEGALLVDPKSPEEIAVALDKVITRSAYRKELVEKGLENVKRFSAREIARQYIELYHTVSNEA